MTTNENENLIAESDFISGWYGYSCNNTFYCAHRKDPCEQIYHTIPINKNEKPVSNIALCIDEENEDKYNGEHVVLTYDNIKKLINQVVLLTNRVKELENKVNKLS